MMCSACAARRAAIRLALAKAAKGVRVVIAASGVSIVKGKG